MASATARDNGNLPRSMAGPAVHNLIRGVEGKRRIRIDKTAECRIDEVGGIVDEVLGGHLGGGGRECQGERETKPTGCWLSKPREGRIESVGGSIGRIERKRERES